MADKLTFDALWNELKEDDASKELLEVSENVATIINSIVAARINKGWTQRDLANICGIKQSAIARMERLQAIPRLDTVVKIARKLNMQICAEALPVEVTVSEPNFSVTVKAVSTVQSWSNNQPVRYNPNRKLLAGLVAAGI